MRILLPLVVLAIAVPLVSANPASESRSYVAGVGGDVMGMPICSEGQIVGVDGAGAACFRLYGNVAAIDIELVDATGLAVSADWALGDYYSVGAYTPLCGKTFTWHGDQPYLYVIPQQTKNYCSHASASPATKGVVRVTYAYWN